MREDIAIRVEVAYALPQQQELIQLKLRQGTTAVEAVEQSGILRRFPSIDPATLQLGIFGKPIPLGWVLQEGDRVEIYRPLIVDPKALRRLRAAKISKGKGRNTKF